MSLLKSQVLGRLVILERKFFERVMKNNVIRDPRKWAKFASRINS